MKRYIWILIGVMFAAPAVAQQIPLYSQYSINPFLYNPARAGQREGVNLNLIYRKMWTNIPGAPDTRAVTLDGSLANKKVGLGGYLFQDNTSIIKRFGGYVTYAYHIKLKEDMHLSIGVSAGAVQTSINWNEARFDDNTVDPVQGTDNQSGVAFDATAGINYQFKGLNVGFAVPQLFQSKTKYLSNNGSEGYTLGRHYLLNASYEVPIKDKFYIEPAVMFRTIEGKSFQIDAGAKFDFKHIVWVSAMYRYDYAVTVGAGVRLHDRFSIGYAYDIAVNGLKGQSGGSHEVFVGIKFGKKEDKGVIEEIKKLQESQKAQDDRLDSLEHKTTEIDQRTIEIKQLNDKLQEDLNKKDKNIEDLNNQLNTIIKKMAEQDSAINGSKKPVDLPPDLIYKGSKDDLEFIMGQPDANYFLVVSSVRTEELARKIAKGLQDKGNKVGIVYNKRRTWYYIFLQKPGDLQAGIKELYKVRKETEFKDAWIHIYE